MAEAPLCSSGTSAAADTVREAWSVAGLTSRPAAIPGVAVFQLPPVSALQAGPFPAVQVRLEGQSAEVDLGVVPAHILVAG